MHAVYLKRAAGARMTPLDLSFAAAGKGWKSSWGALDTKVATACCACGGGSTGAGTFSYY